MSDDFPAELRLFIEQHIETLSHLEILLLLRQTPAQEWEPAAVAKMLYTTVEMCAAQLADLAQRGFLKASAPPSVRYHYQPANEETDRLLAQLATVYQERRVAVITLIYSKPVNKVRTFADAFRLRKEE